MVERRSATREPDVVDIDDGSADPTFTDPTSQTKSDKFALPGTSYIPPALSPRALVRAAPSSSKTGRSLLQIGYGILAAHSKGVVVFFSLKMPDELGEMMFCHALSVNFMGQALFHQAITLEQNATKMKVDMESLQSQLENARLEAQEDC
uniref:Uncharacterized protein n=1 Tax=Nelumbo nucifera TaxID=4432 RepID=A0A822XY95_NELNU|nr:TPA_asm: hypothetical protein HUJ06_026147 [Nelumbo nucifera]